MSKGFWSQWNPRRSRGASWLKGKQVQEPYSLSGTPAEAGVRVEDNIIHNHCKVSQWNPRRSRGARSRIRKPRTFAQCLSGTPAEAGVRAVQDGDGYSAGHCLSGTPAEAGVRG